MSMKNTLKIVVFKSQYIILSTKEMIEEGKFRKTNNNNKTVSSFANLSNEEYVKSIVNNAFP